MAATRDDMIAELERTIAELRQERDAALAQKAALAEVLDVINHSPGNLVTSRPKRTRAYPRPSRNSAGEPHRQMRLDR
jgi:hypothetical protein